MSSQVVVGTQWGDEGKGKIVDVLAEKADMIVRFQGGDNAGHTVIVNGKKYVLQLLPSGVLHEEATCVIGPGVVCNPFVLLEEMQHLEEGGLKCDHIVISDRAQMLMPYHRYQDQLEEEAANSKIGTTKRGIGPCYADKYTRIGLRVGDLIDFEAFKLEDILDAAAKLLAEMTGCTAVIQDVEPTRQRLTGFDIVHLSNHDALAVLTLDESKPVTVQFAIPKNFLSSDLEILHKLVQERFLGNTVLDIHYRLRTEIPQIVQKYFKITDNVLDLFDYIFSQLFKELIFIEGKVASLTYADLKTYQFLDNPQHVALELRSAISDDEVTKISVAESTEEALENVTVMSHKFLIPYRGMALMHVIGPVEMDYRRMVSLVNVISRVLVMKLTDYYRYLNSNHYEVS